MNVTILIFPNVQIMDFAGPHEIFGPYVVSKIKGVDEALCIAKGLEYAWSENNLR